VREPLRRIFDVVVSASILAVTAPVVVLAIVAIRLESPGHPIYRQRRIGKDGAAFDVLKLRTMVSGAEKMGAGLAVNDGDSRITRVGALLRRTSIDELPNLVNVLRGEMSIIGPRPTVPVQVEQYTDRQRGRLALKPGITGWAQVNGWQGETPDVSWMEKRVKFDLQYIQRWTLLWDLKIILLTIFGRKKSNNAF
jgi:lipopolysaccharide/colanic/teichoic acid biosynthesis glycosyltransferase